MNSPLNRGERLPLYLINVDGIVSIVCANCSEFRRIRNTAGIPELEGTAIVNNQLLEQMIGHALGCKNESSV